MRPPDVAAALAEAKASPAVARLSDWVRIADDGTATVFTGKVELGQGVSTALLQIAADALCLPMALVRLVAGDTAVSPDEGYTAGSRSIQVGGVAIRVACSDALKRLAEAADARLGTTSEPDGQGAFRSREGSIRYAELAADVDWTLPLRHDAAHPWPPFRHWVGQSVPRLDLPAKLRGGAFIHDRVVDGMLHGRVLRPPWRRARLLALDEDAVRRVAVGVDVVRDGSFVGLLARREEQAVAAAETASRNSRWQAAPADSSADPFAFSDPVLLRTQQVGSPGRAGADGRVLQAAYSRAFIAHASIGPSCALARFDASTQHLTVWTHSQGVFQLRADLARTLRLAASRIEVRHVPGAGCYGHNGADDVALDAALLARARPGSVVRVQWSRADELGCSPVGSAMRTRICARFDHAARTIDWELEVDSGSHMNRPGSSTEGVNLLAAADLAEPVLPGTPIDTTLEQGGGGDRNALALYDFTSQQVRYRFFPEMPLRTSSLRGLGAFCNVFAIESFMDELADAIDEDAIDLRLRLLGDPRARDVIAAARAMVEDDGGRAAANTAVGCGFARYKNLAAYCAVFIELEVEADVRLLRAWCAVDAGEVVNPDGLVNQIEGGIVQAASWTLKERVDWQAGCIHSTQWDDYPILRFSEVPEIRVRVLDGCERPSLGVGEAAQGPTAAAIANAVTRALGVRPRDLPITRESLTQLTQSA